jgi:hypothetical protein
MVSGKIRLFSDMFDVEQTSNSVYTRWFYRCTEVEEDNAVQDVVLVRIVEVAVVVAADPDSHLIRITLLARQLDSHAPPLTTGPLLSPIHCTLMDSHPSCRLVPTATNGRTLDPMSILMEQKLDQTSMTKP